VRLDAPARLRHGEGEPEELAEVAEPADNMELLPD
jgi:hypothetical protein